MYTQYMFNGVLYNPAYVGSHGVTSVTLQNRTQWLQMEGAPSTFIMTAHTLLDDKYNAVGAMIFRDQIGATVQTGLRGMFSHKVLLNRKDAQLNLALQVGLVNQRTNNQELLIKDEDDVNFQDSPSKLLPNFGFGILYNVKRYYITISAPRILNTKLFKEIPTSTHFYLGGGVSIPIKQQDFVLKPNVLARMVSGAPIQFDANLNLEMYEKYWVGVSYRIGESIDFLVEYKILDNLRIGYSYDLTTNQLRDNVGSTHEIMLNYRLNSAQSKSRNRPYDPRNFGA